MVWYKQTEISPAQSVELSYLPIYMGASKASPKEIITVNIHSLLNASTYYLYTLALFPSMVIGL